MGISIRLTRYLIGLINKNDLRFDQAIARAILAVRIDVLRSEVLGLGFSYSARCAIASVCMFLEFKGSTVIVGTVGCGRPCRVPDAACTAPTVHRRYPVG